MPTKVKAFLTLDRYIYGVATDDCQFDQNGDCESNRDSDRSFEEAASNYLYIE